MIREQGAELLVLGTHARSGLPKFVLGSVAESAFREAKCAVMTVGPHARKGRGSGAPPEHLLVPTDLSFESSNALRYGVSLATAIGGDVTLLNVQSRNSYSFAAHEVKEPLAESIDEHARATTTVFRRAEYGSPASTILAVAGQLDSELIVMGLEAWSDRPTPMWLTEYEIVLRARCPVLSMRTPAPSDA
jgi:nucleotide-binding universal stress UspA family protein